ncbi:phage tail family protein [Romboutsia lituseburensis]|uniref:phage tail family protein n=1 Tax=Romboutsia lituseburensis TaxID=1537 RepID=UPI00215A1E37|nr:phage tail family protein [Romboutsia lituseburensis]MCR8744335.1 phage tail family protein [Romboutsia lituseburensis]
MQKLIYRNKKGQELTLCKSRPFLLESIDNYANVNTNISFSNNVTDGVSIDTVSIKEKILPVTGAIIASSREDLDRKRAYLSALFNPKFQATLTYINNALTRKIDCIVQDITFQSPIGFMQKFLVQFICPNPFWRDINTKKTDIALWQGDFEFELEIEDEGIEMGHRVSNLICNIANYGDVSCGMKIQFRALATVVNPSLFNVNTREFIKINRILEKGDLLEVTTDYSNKRIELVKSNSTRQNVFNWLDLDSEFLKLEVGDNLFRYDAEHGIDNLEVSIYYTPLYLGV